MASSSSTCTSLQPSILPSEPLPWRPSTSPKLPPGALLDIADDLLWDLFTEWLHIEDVCHLDSALCQKKRRPYFLQLLATKVLLFNREEVQVLTDPHTNDDPHTHRALGAEALNWVLKRGIHLASLQLFGYEDIKNASEQESILEAVASLALDGRLDKLETISVNWCFYFKDPDLAAVLSKCYNSMKSINIEGCGLTESAAALIKRCTKLEAFTPYGNESAAEMVEIFQACRKLRKVDISAFEDRLTDEVVYSLADNCHLLEHLHLLDCSEVSDAAVRRVAELCPLLQFVNLMRTQITGEALVSLCNRCILLKRMFLEGCVNLTDEAVLAMAKRLPGLTHIDLAHIEAINSTAVDTLVSKCRALEYIDLSNGPDVSDVTLMKIAEHCSNLKELRVSYCPDVSDAALMQIAEHCSKLRVLNVSNCPDVSDAALMKLAEHCSKLEELNVLGCPNVTSVGVAEIRSKCSKLRTFYYNLDEVIGDGEEEEDVDEDEDKE